MDFQTTLAIDASPSDVLFYVTSNDGARTTYPWRATIDDEVVYVMGGVRLDEILPAFEPGVISDGLIWYVRRGADDTDPADHLAGAILRGVRVRGTAPTPELLADDEAVPIENLTDEDETDWLESDAPEGF